MSKYSKIKECVARDLSQDIFSQLLKLNCGSGGVMRNKLLMKDKSKVFYIEDDKGKVVSWGLLLKWWIFYKYEINLYTPSSKRGHAFASRILKFVIAKHGCSNLYGSYYCSNIFKLNGCKDSGK